MLLPCSLDASHFAAPGHDRGVGSQAALQDFVPADDVASPAVDKLLDAVDKPALQGFFVSQSFALHQGLAVGTLLPGLLGALVATNVYIVAGKQVHHFCQYIFQKAESMLFGAIDLVEHVEVVAHHIRLAQTAGQFRIGCQCRRGMSGHFYFGDDGDEAVGSILHDFPDLVLRVVAACGFPVEAAGIIIVRMAYLCLRTVRADFRQAGIFLDLDAPALVVREVEVEDIHLVGSHQVDELQHFLLGQEVAPDVHHGPSVGEAGRVFDADSRDFQRFPERLPGIINLRRKQLQQRLHAIEPSGSRSVGRDVDALSVHYKPVGFVGQGAVHGQAEVCFCSFGHRLQGD